MLTDNEIIKALEICASGTCEGCNTKHGYDCVPLDMGTILSLINRQKAEIEKWQGGYMTQKQEIANLEIELKAMRGAANSYKAEIERLRYNLEAVLNERADHSEAIKEFAERLKDKSSKISLVCSGALVKTDYTIAGTDLNNLVKEMVGADNE